LKSREFGRIGFKKLKVFNAFQRALCQAILVPIAAQLFYGENREVCQPGGREIAAASHSRSWRVSLLRLCPHMITANQKGKSMGVMEREFYRSWRGPAPGDEDSWSLVFDTSKSRLLVRHEWESTGHSGVAEFKIDEFLSQEGAAQATLIDILFEERGN
jgi:hypothetical protein